jgi:hypothetical protein
MTLAVALGGIAGKLGAVAPLGVSVSLEFTPTQFIIPVRRVVYSIPSPYNTVAGKRV